MIWYEFLTLVRLYLFKKKNSRLDEIIGELGLSIKRGCLENEGLTGSQWERLTRLITMKLYLQHIELKSLRRVASSRLDEL